MTDHFARLGVPPAPWLDPETHERLVRELMDARRVLQDAGTPMERVAARVQIDTVKRALGERGDVWWDDGAPDYNHEFAINTPYADWFTSNSE